jgi:hypothetical protein
MDIFNFYPDKIALVYGVDGDPNPNKTTATIAFIHKNWIDVVGRLFPPYFTGDFTDTWLSDIADKIDRKIKIDIYTEHIHYAFNKRAEDETDKEKWEKHFRLDMPKLYINTERERIEEADKLQKFIQSYK